MGSSPGLIVAMRLESMAGFLLRLVAGGGESRMTDGDFQRTILRVAITDIDNVVAADGDGCEAQALRSGTRDDLSVP